MSIELSRSRVELMVGTMIRDKLGVWNAVSRSVPLPPSVVESLTTMIVATMWEVAAVTSSNGPEKGILAGVRMIKTWED